MYIDIWFFLSFMRMGVVLQADSVSMEIAREWVGCMYEDKQRCSWEGCVFLLEC